MENDIVRMLFLRRQRQKKRWKIKTISGAPPLSFKAKAGALKDYRIYGNTANGESVGDRTGNLFDMKKFAETCFEYGATVNYTNNTLTFTATGIDAYVNAAFSTGKVVPLHYRSSCIDVLPSTTYTISMSSAPRCFISWVDSSFNVVSIFTAIPTNATSYTFTTPENCTKLLIRLGKQVTNIGDTFTISDIMLNSGLTALPYEPHGYKVPVTVSNGTDTLTTSIYLPEQIRKVGDEAEYIDYGEQKQHRVRKNLLPTITATDSKSGILLRSESDGTVIVNGTATARTFFTLKENISYPFDTILSGCPQGGSSEGYCLRAMTMAAYTIVATDFGNGALIPANTEIYIEIRIENGFECNNLEFTPMIRKVDIEDDTYEPYIENTDLDVTLPALPTLSGTNVLTVGTAVQPSGVEITGRIKKGE